MKIHPVFHSSQLKPTEGEPRRQAPIRLAGEAEEEFEVDRVLRERVVKGKKQYLIRWKGYSSFDDTWEPLENLGNA